MIIFILGMCLGGALGIAGEQTHCGIVPLAVATSILLLAGYLGGIVH